MNDALQVLAGGWFDAAAKPVPIGDGRINDTLLVVDAAGRRYVLQRINERVFADPALVMTNLVRIRALLERRAPGMIPELVATRNGEPAWVDGANGWWRLWRFVEGTRSLGRTADPAIALSAGRTFGHFQRLLAELTDPPLAPTIPGFLELDGYLGRLDELLSADAAASGEVTRAAGAEDFIDAHRRLAELFPPQTDYIHGDCKLNNLLFAQEGAEVAAVLDLDTVMRGNWAWDFGDLARSLLLGGGDEGLLFSAAVAGFVAGSGRRPAVAALVQAPVYIAFMLGVRFLTDHMDGDRYFKVAARGDNLRRAHDQFDLVRDLEAGCLRFEAAAAEGLRAAESQG